MSSKASYTIPLYPLFFIFLILKLCHVIDWSWWWVTSPLWIGFGMVLLIFGFVAVVALMACVGIVIFTKGK